MPVIARSASDEAMTKNEQRDEISPPPAVFFHQDLRKTSPLPLSEGEGKIPCPLPIRGGAGVGCFENAEILM